MKVLIKNGVLINPENKDIASGKKYDILFEHDKVHDTSNILKIEKKIDESEAKYVLDASGCIVSPGFVDIHANFMDPGITAREDLKTGCLSAASGGYTSVVLGVENKPTTDQVNVIDYINNYRDIMPIKMYIVGTLTDNREAEEIVDMFFLKCHGVVGFSDGLRGIENEELLKKAMLQSLTLSTKLPITLYPEDTSKIRQRGINEGIAKELKIGSSPTIAEDKELDRILNVASEIYDIEKEKKKKEDKIGAKIDIAYISTKNSVDKIKNIKKAKPNIDITTEVQALALFFKEDALKKKGTNAKVLPPLRTQIDQNALIKGLEDNTIDIISSNHFPCTEEEKSTKLIEASCGAIGLETVLGICGAKLVGKSKCKLTWEDIIYKISINPAKLYSIDAGCLRVGGPADITIFDPNEEWKVVDKFNSKSHNTPLIGEKLKGKIKYTICNGICVYREMLDEEQSEEKK